MNYRLIITALGFIWLINVGCNDCNKVRCENASGFIQVKFTRNGQNAIFGPDAFINRDSIRYFITKPLERDYDIGYHESIQTITLFMEEGYEQILEISNIRTDTLVSTMEVTGVGECCPLNEFLISVTMNGQAICVPIQDRNCGEIIEIEI